MRLRHGLSGSRWTSGGSRLGCLLGEHAPTGARSGRDGVDLGAGHRHQVHPAGLVEPQDRLEVDGLAAGEVHDPTDPGADDQLRALPAGQARDVQGRPVAVLVGDPQQGVGLSVVQGAF